MRITYEKNSAYIYLLDNPAPGQAATQQVVELDGGDLVLDLDAKGKLIGIEVLGGRKVLPAEVIAQARYRPPLGSPVSTRCRDAGVSRATDPRRFRPRLRRL